MTHDEIQWEYCPVPSIHLHGRYRGFDLHRWGDTNLCFYPSEGEASELELLVLMDRISANFKEYQFDKVFGAYRGFRRKVTSHVWKVKYKDEEESCEFKARLDGHVVNFCLEIHGQSIEEELTMLDTIIDALWQDSGLRQAQEPLPVGRWR